MGRSYWSPCRKEDGQPRPPPWTKPALLLPGKPSLPVMQALPKAQASEIASSAQEPAKGNRFPHEAAKAGKVRPRPRVPQDRCCWANLLPRRLPLDTSCKRKKVEAEPHLEGGALGWREEPRLLQEPPAASSYLLHLLHPHLEAQPLQPNLTKSQGCRWEGNGGQFPFPTPPLTLPPGAGEGGQLAPSGLKRAREEPSGHSRDQAGRWVSRVGGGVQRLPEPRGLGPVPCCVSMPGAHHAPTQQALPRLLHSDVYCATFTAKERVRAGEGRQEEETSRHTEDLVKSERLGAQVRKRPRMFRSLTGSPRGCTLFLPWGLGLRWPPRP